MKGTEKIILAWVAFLFAVSLCVLVGPFIPWSAHRLLHSATAAAWAQTAGTVLAMLSGAGAIAWQVRFESRREVRRDLQGRLDATKELGDLANEANAQVRVLLEMTAGPYWHADALARLLAQEDYELRWYEIHSTFEKIDFSAIPGARLKLAFLRAKTAFSSAFVAHGEIFQRMQGPDRNLRPTTDSLARSATHLQHATLQIGVLVQILIHELALVG